MERIIYLLAIILLLHLKTQCQPTTVPFPQRCEGTWNGNLTILKKGIPTDTVPVKLSVAPIPHTNRHTWKTEYLSEKYPVVKNYEMVPSDSMPHTFILDEKNDIYLYLFQTNNKLHGQFSVNGNMLYSTYELRGEQLYFEIATFQPLNNTKGVENYQLINLQKAIFTRDSVR
jgi:hypothetical protein